MGDAKAPQRACRTKGFPIRQALKLADIHEGFVENRRIDIHVFRETKSNETTILWGARIKRSGEQAGIDTHKIPVYRIEFSVR